MRYEPDGDQDLQLDAILNQGLTVQDNMNWAILEIPVVAGINTVQHGLGFVPSGYQIIFTEDETIISGANISSWTTEQLFFNSSASSPKVRLFVL